MDEGTDVGPDHFGIAILDNIMVNGVSVGHRAASSAVFRHGARPFAPWRALLKSSLYRPVWSGLVTPPAQSYAGGHDLEGRAPGASWGN